MPQSRKSKKPKYKTSKAFNFVFFMPPLPHSVPDQPFDIQKSKVIDWIIQDSTVRQYLFSKLVYEGVIVFDHATKTWRGKDYSPQPTVN